MRCTGWLGRGGLPVVARRPMPPITCARHESTRQVGGHIDPCGLGQGKPGRSSRIPVPEGLSRLWCEARRHSLLLLTPGSDSNHSGGFEFLRGLKNARTHRFGVDVDGNWSGTGGTARRWASVTTLQIADHGWTCRKEAHGCVVPQSLATFFLILNAAPIIEHTWCFRLIPPCYVLAMSRASISQSRR